VSRFVVDSHSLLEVRDGLGRLHDQLLGMHTVAGGYDGVLGGRELEGELQHFCGRWHWGIIQIGEQIIDMMGRLTSAAAAYERIEHRVSRAGNGAHPPHGGSGTTVIGGGAGGSGGSGGGSGTTTIG
jgi:hypothetical protein